MTIRDRTDPRRVGDEPACERILGRVDHGRPGPLVIVVAGLHGNEPAGIGAVRRVLAGLGEHELPLAGRLVALCGNRAALSAQRRYLAADLNRLWTSAAIARVRAQPRELDLPEERELRELLEVLELETSLASGPVFLLDLHSTSAPGSPFAILGDTSPARSLARALPLPAILGLEGRIQGHLLSWFADRGHAALVVEGGQNEDPRTQEHHQAAIWLVLAASGALEPGSAWPAREAYACLEKASRGLPALVEVLEGHALEPGDGFRMRPGYVNFQHVRKGEILAEDHAGAVGAPFDGHILMPLYQGLGQDGFFVGRELPRWKLAFSDWLARTEQWRLLPGLPGVHAVPGRPNALHVDEELCPLVRRWIGLCGYRRERREDGRLVVERRPAPGSLHELDLALRK